MNSIEDIYDGTIYQNLITNGLLSNPNNISFTWNTDGVPIFKSSQYALWPLYFIINELNPVERNKRENMLLAGLWFGPSKPNMLTYLKPFKSELKRLESEGFVAENTDNGNYHCKAFVIAGSFDLPAKCLVCNTIQFNGSYGSTKCLRRGLSKKRAKREQCMSFFLTKAIRKGL